MAFTRPTSTYKLMGMLSSDGRDRATHSDTLITFRGSGFQQRRALVGTAQSCFPPHVYTHLGKLTWDRLERLLPIKRARNQFRSPPLEWIHRVVCRGPYFWNALLGHSLVLRPRTPAWWQGCFWAFARLLALRRRVVVCLSQKEVAAHVDVRMAPLDGERADNERRAMGTEDMREPTLPQCGFVRRGRHEEPSSRSLSSIKRGGVGVQRTLCFELALDGEEAKRSEMLAGARFSASESHSSSDGSMVPKSWCPYNVVSSCISCATSSSELRRREIE
ncbi:hypothetical protein B0H11DRAFT_1957760 [Mycena galericulata]|nr:hypothetical protein B0H11DRAFT_1957760 [Mycena galericulata]